jgi:hypothetical protein
VILLWKIDSIRSNGAKTILNVNLTSWSRMDLRDFSFQNPKFIRSSELGDGVFRIPGNVILGLTKNRDHLVSVGIGPADCGSFCSLVFWRFNLIAWNVDEISACYNLFSKNGMISTMPSGFIVRFFEIVHSNLRFIVTGQNPNDSSNFVYFTLIFHDSESRHFSFPVNHPTFRWSTEKCLLKSTLSIVANCESSVKMMTVLDHKIHFFQFNVEKFLANYLKESMRLLEFFNVQIVDKSEERCSIILAIGFIFYHDQIERWSMGTNLIEVPVDGKSVRHLYQNVHSYENRPLVTAMHEDLHESMRIFSQFWDCGADEVLTNEGDGYYRGIAVPEWNLIIIDEMNGKIVT